MVRNCRRDCGLLETQGNGKECRRHFVQSVIIRRFFSEHGSLCDISVSVSHVSVHAGHEMLVDLRLVSTELRGVTSISLTLPLEWRTALFA